MSLRRARGWLLRLVRRRAGAIVIGLLLALPAAYLEFSGRFAAWWVDGLSLVLGATGAALILSGVGGVVPRRRAS
jgi:hypothetical protein